MRQKQYVISKGLPGQAILKNRAMAGEAVYNWHFMSPTQLASELRQSYGICVEKPVLSGAEAVFLLYGIIKEADSVGRYFTARSISDVQTSLTAINRLRLQLSSGEEELDGLRRLLKEEDGRALIPQKNRAIITELAEPYLNALKEKGLEDSITVMRKTIEEGKQHELPLMEGCGIFVEERPLAPLEKELAMVAFSQIQMEKENIVLGGNYGTTNTIKKFDAYGASNEVRTIVERIQKDGKPLDQYLIACGNLNQYQSLLKEYEGLGMTVDGGERVSGSRVCLLAETILNWHRNAYTKESFQEMADHLDSQKLRKKMMEDGVEEKEAWKLWNTVLFIAKTLYFSLDTGENKTRLAEYKKLIEMEEGSHAEQERKAIPYCELFADMMTVETILKDMIYLRDGNPFELQSYGIFLSILKASRRYEGQKDIDLLPTVLQLCERQKAGGGNPEAGKVHLCSWNKAHLYKRPVVFLCGLQSLTGSISENAILLDGDIELVKSRVRDSELKTTSEQIRARSEDFLRIVEYLKQNGTDLILSWSTYSLNELKTLSVPAVLADVDGTVLERAGFPLEKAPKAVAATGNSASGTKEKGMGELPMLTLTPSAAEQMLTCPYSFVLKNLLKIREPEDDESQTTWLDAKEKGTFCHSVFEEFVHWDRSEERKEQYKTMTADQIREERKTKIEEISNVVLRQWEIRKPYLGNEDRTKQELSEIVTGFLNLWATLPEGTVKSTEEYVEDRVIIENKLQCHGIPDLVMELDGRGIVVLDYKTGKKVKHEENDPVSCAQTLLYCMMLSQKEYKDQKLSTTYLYPLLEQAVGCNYDSDVQKTLKELFTKAIERMEKGEDWIRTEDPGKEPTCGFCKLKGFCTRDFDVKERLFEEEDSDDDDDDR